MPKLNVYVDDELLKRVKNSGIELSKICRDALWDALEKENVASCRKCKAPAKYHIRRENGTTYACDDHVMLYLGDLSTVRAI